MRSRAAGPWPCGRQGAQLGMCEEVLPHPLYLTTATPARPSTVDARRRINGAAGPRARKLSPTGSWIAVISVVRAPQPPNPGRPGCVFMHLGVFMQLGGPPTARALSLGLLNLRSWPFGILSPPPHWERSGSGKRCAAARWSQGIVSPPSTDRLCPVTAFDASEAKKTHACVCVWQRRLLECRRLCYSLFDAPPFSGGPAVPPLDLLLSVGRRLGGRPAACHPPRSQFERRVSSPGALSRRPIARRANRRVGPCVHLPARLGKIVDRRRLAQWRAGRHKAKHLLGR